MRVAAQERAAYRWRTVAEVANDPRLTVSAAHVRRFIESGELAAIDVSSPGSSRPTYRIDPASVDALVERRIRGRAA